MQNSNLRMVREDTASLYECSVQRINLTAELVTYSIAANNLTLAVDLNFLAAYWLWDLQNQIDCVRCQWSDQILSKSCELKLAKLNKQSIDEAYLETKVQELVDLLDLLAWNPSVIIIHGKAKVERRANSRRRSDYIGVSKNGPNWQSMISIQKKKIYIGTYQNEREAAIAFDFYSILIHHFDAKTNFNYSKSIIMEMLINFKTNGNVFIPSEGIS